jgi:hypothetical protein
MVPFVVASADCGHAMRAPRKSLKRLAQVRRRSDGEGDPRCPEVTTAWPEAATHGTRRARVRLAPARSSEVALLREPE